MPFDCPHAVLATGEGPLVSARVVRSRDSRMTIRVMGTRYPLPGEWSHVPRLVKNDRAFVAKGVDRHDPTAIDAAAQHASRRSNELQLSAGTGLHAQRRFDQGAARTQIDDGDVLAGSENCCTGPRSASGRYTDGASPLERDRYSSCHRRDAASNHNTRIRPVAPMMRMAICGPVGADR